MYLELLINNQKADIISEEKIKILYQCNNISRVDTRDANHTYAFNLPKTPNNIQIFEGLGIASDTSTIPYSKVEASLKIDGFILIKKGWLFIHEVGADYYQVNLQSGVVDFFKAIQNRKMSMADLNEIDHDKNAQNVIASVDNPYYKYLIADYNGLSHYEKDGNTLVNIDPMVPSVSVKYLWDKVHEYAGFAYTGSIFNVEDFSNLWLTYSKSTSPEITSEIFNGTANGWCDAWGRKYGAEHKYSYAYLLYNTDNKQTDNYELIQYPTIQYNGNTINEYGFFKIKKSGKYRFNIDSTFGHYGTLKLCVNTQNDSPENAYNSSPYKEIDLNNEVEENGKKLYKGQGYIDKKLNEGDIVYFVFKHRKSAVFRARDNVRGFVVRNQITISRMTDDKVFFQEDLSQLSMTDFVKEIINRFGLTMLVDIDKREVKYLTINERVNADAVDWSSKYIERNLETYVFEDYAQENTFKLQYNDKEDDYNNGTIKVDNLNLEIEKEVFASKFYSPERNGTENFYLGDVNEDVLLLKFFDKELKSNNATTGDLIKYKPLQKRFHLIKSKEVQTNVRLGSKVLNKDGVANKVAVATFSGLSFSSLVDKYYKDLRAIINRSRIHHIKLNLNVVDVMTLRLDRLYYFKQEAQYYLLNILEYNTNGEVVGEFVRVDKMEKGSGLIQTNCRKFIIKYDDDPDDLGDTIVTYIDCNGQNKSLTLNYGNGDRQTEICAREITSFNYDLEITDTGTPCGQNELTADIEWNPYAIDANNWDEPTQDRYGNFDWVSVYIANTSGEVAGIVYQIKNEASNGVWIDYSSQNSIDMYYVNLAIGLHEFRIKVTTTNGQVYTSNILKYTRI